MFDVKAQDTDTACSSGDHLEISVSTFIQRV